MLFVANHLYISLVDTSIVLYGVRLWLIRRCLAQIEYSCPAFSVMSDSVSVSVLGMGLVDFVFGQISWID